MLPILMLMDWAAGEVVVVEGDFKPFWANQATTVEEE
jgi:hypothetical protein